MPKQKILLIDGSHVLMELIRRMLERRGYSVRMAVGLAGAREWLDDMTPDGIILENELPDGSGLDYCRKLREKSGVPIMFVSGNRDDELPALQAEANDFLKKPCDYDVMIALLGIMLNGISHS